MSVEPGSYRLIVSLTRTVASALKADLQALRRPDSLGDIDPKRAEIVAKWQARTKESKDLVYVVKPFGIDANPIELSNATDYREGEATTWVKVEKYLFGTVFDMGGAKKANVDIRLDDSGEVIRVGTDQDYLKAQSQNRLYKKSLVRVEAEQNSRTHALRNLRLLSFEDYEPRCDDAALDRFAEEGRRAWADVPDAADWVRQLRGSM